MESDGRVQPRTLVNATSRPRLIANQTRSQPFVLTPLLRQVAVDSVRRTRRITREDVPSHESEHMFARVLCRLEAVDALDDIQAAEIRATSCDTLTLDDRVRVVVAMCLADIGERDWYVSYPGWSPRT